MKREDKKAQVWVETVIYTLIAFAMIGLVLSFVRPKIEESQDKALIEQSIQIMQDLDQIIEDIRDVPGNKRKLNLFIKEGKLKIDATNDQIVFELESRYEYSESGQTIQQGKINISTIDKGEFNEVIALIDYSDSLNLTYNSEEETKIMSATSTSYQVFVSNKGDLNEKTIKKDYRLSSNRNKFLTNNTSVEKRKR